MNSRRVGSVEEAVRLAEELKRSDHSYWFRGQAKDWPIRSSFVRLKPEDRQLALEKRKRGQVCF